MFGNGHIQLIAARRTGIVIIYNMLSCPHIITKLIAVTL